MRRKRIIYWVAGILALLAAIPLFFFFVILDRSGRPYCHKQIEFALHMWMEEQKDTNAFPNINGRSAESLTAIRGQMGGSMRWAQGYRYVPGLRRTDPGDLVLAYVDQPTRWVWHASHPTRFKPKAWLLVPVDFTWGNGRRLSGAGGELSERVSKAEFKERLQRTLDFIRANQRPNWQSIVAEHSKFLESLDPNKK